MASVRGNARAQVGSAGWISEERSAAFQIADAETEEFTFSVRNELDWLNEHMAEIFSENQINVAQIFKTPGKWKGKTPRTIRKHNPLEARVPLSDVFSATPRAQPNPFHLNFERPAPTFTVAEDKPVEVEEKPTIAPSPVKKAVQPSRVISVVDSGYHGSQMDDATQLIEPSEHGSDTQLDDTIEITEQNLPDAPTGRYSEERRTTEGSFQSAKEEQTRTVAVESVVEIQSSEQVVQPQTLTASTIELSDDGIEKQKEDLLPAPVSNESPAKSEQNEPDHDGDLDEEQVDDIHSPSDGSSPVRPIVRKSSLNFASLPAREPLTTKKSIGNRTSRTSHLDQTRTSYYPRHTGGKSLGNVKGDALENDRDEMDIDKEDNSHNPRKEADSIVTQLHNKTSTQRLQDQISMLGQSQAPTRPAPKNIAAPGAVPSFSSQPNNVLHAWDARPAVSPQRNERGPTPLAPGAFPDDEDSWIGPSTAVPVERTLFSPRPPLTKSQTTNTVGKSSIEALSKRVEDTKSRSPFRDAMHSDRIPNTLGHAKSASTSVLGSPGRVDDPSILGHKKAVSVSNSEPSNVTESSISTTPPRSPLRSYKGSPLKAAKDKFSSILKTSRGLFASSAAISADAKSAALSPPSALPSGDSEPSLDEVIRAETKVSSESLYPNLDSQLKAQHQQDASGPEKASVRRTRASLDREERRKEEEAREAQRVADQLEKARQKVKEEARVYHLEQERVAAQQKQIQERKEQERLSKESKPEIPRATRSSPRRNKAQLEEEGIVVAAPSSQEQSSKDVEMTDSSSMPPPAVPRPKSASQSTRPGVKRPLRPAKEQISKTKPPTVIKVDTGSQRGHQYHPSTTTLAASLQETLSTPASGPQTQSSFKGKASTSSLQSKASASSFKSSAAKALEAAARKKEQDELAAQRKREAKQEMERQRAALKEEERRQQEQQRRREVERQQGGNLTGSVKVKETNAARQAMEKRRLDLEKAKQTPAPPPAVRHQLGGESSQKAPAVTPGMHRSQDELGRPVNGGLHNTTKAPPKRPLQHDLTDEHASRPQIQRSGPSYQYNEPHTKRRRTNEGEDDDEEISNSQPKMLAPPIRQSGVRPKDAPTKSLFPTGYVSAPQTNLQRSTLIAQHNLNQSKPAHPMDMAQVSKAPIQFASGSSQAVGQSHKTPARPVGMPNGGKSTAKSAKSSPHYPNGDNIDLPEICTDSEDEDSDAGNDFVALSWTNSPDLRKQLVKQESIDPADVFGRPGPLNMEEVFSKSKDRWHKFRARTSSANWSGQDRLTEDEVKKDLEARDRLRRQGGWTYDTMI
ncbi:hypothetical protein F5884DRAFT_796820 [Xylogone sp. PMI_703]|nr:hypothetical protein F5884DRAFT_796820 [Xylogone sp. PMI_703]